MKSRYRAQAVQNLKVIVTSTLGAAHHGASRIIARNAKQAYNNHI
jgi:hypothetical protein